MDLNYEEFSPIEIPSEIPSVSLKYFPSPLAFFATEIAFLIDEEYEPLFSLKRKADEGDMWAMYEYAMRLKNKDYWGDNIKNKDYWNDIEKNFWDSIENKDEETKKYFLRAAGMGHIEAMKECIPFLKRKGTEKIKIRSIHPQAMSCSQLASEFEKIIKTPKNIRIFASETNKYGTDLKNKGNIKKATKFFKIASDYKSPSGMYNYARCLYNNEKLDEAEKLYEEILEIAKKEKIVKEVEEGSKKYIKKIEQKKKAIRPTNGSGGDRLVLTNSSNIKPLRC